jgi:predicted RND superfamily exporter protein
VAAFIRFLLRNRALAAATLVVTLGLAMFSARTIQLRFQFRDFFDYPANPHLALFKEDNEEFGDPAGYVVAMIDADDVFRKDVLEYVQKVTNRLEPDPIFVRIRSLTNVHAIRGNGDDVASGPLMNQIPETPAAMADVKRFALASPLLQRRLVSVDGKTTAVLAQMRTPAQFSSVPEQQAAIESMQKVLAATPPPAGVQVRLTGAPVVEVGVTQSLIKDQMVLMPAVMSVLLLMLFLTFRSSHGIVLCMAAVNVATIWTAGIFALFGRPVDIIGSVIPTTILVYGVVDPIFVLTRVLGKLEAGKKKEDAIVESFTELGLPCFLTSLTTALGFAAFVTARAPTIRYYGVSVAIGVLLAWVTTMTVLPILLSVVPAPKKKFGGLASTRWIDGRITSLWGFLKGRLALTIAATCVVLVAGVLVARKQHIDNVYVDGLPHKQTQSDVRVLEQRLWGVVRLIVDLDGPQVWLNRPEVLAAIEAIVKTM